MTEKKITINENPGLNIPLSPDKIVQLNDIFYSWVEGRDSSDYDDAFTELCSALQPKTAERKYLGQLFEDRKSAMQKPFLDN